MAVDLSGLKLKKVTAPNWEDYPVGGSSLPPHDPGVYALRVKKIAYEAKDGFLKIIMDLVFETPEEGRDPEIRTWLSTKPRDRGRRAGTSSASDFLNAIGSEANPGEDQQEWADAIEETKDGIVQAQIDWSAYDSDREVELAASYADFPKDEAGKTLPYVTDVVDGKSKRFSARQKLRFFVNEQ